MGRGPYYYAGTRDSAISPKSSPGSAQAAISPTSNQPASFGTARNAAAYGYSYMIASFEPDVRSEYGSLSLGPAKGPLCRNLDPALASWA